MFQKSDFTVLPEDAIFDVLPSYHFSSSAAVALAPLICTFGDTDLFLSLPLVHSSNGLTRSLGHMLRTSYTALKKAFEQGKVEKKVIYVKQTPRDPISFGSISERPGNVVFELGNLSEAEISVTQRYFLGSYDQPCWVDQGHGQIILNGTWFPDRPAALLLVCKDESDKKKFKDFPPLALVIGKSRDDMFWVACEPVQERNYVRQADLYSRCDTVPDV